MTVTILFVLLWVPNIHAENTLYDKKIEFAISTEEILAHLKAAYANHKDGNLETSRQHMSKPLLEIYPQISEELSDYPEYRYKLELILYILKNANMEMTSEQFIREISFVEKILRQGEDLIIGKELKNDPSFKIELVTRLLDRSATKLVQVSTLGGMDYIITYQHGLFLITQSQQVLDTISPNNFNSPTIHLSHRIFEL